MKDSIERQDVINEIEERKNANGYYNVAVISELNRLEGYIMRLPPAQPEIIRCKDCIYWWESNKLCKRNKDKNHNCACMDCDADFYCGNAERRTDE